MWVEPRPSRGGVELTAPELRDWQPENPRRDRHMGNPIIKLHNLEMVYTIASLEIVILGIVDEISHPMKFMDEDMKSYEINVNMTWFGSKWTYHILWNHLIHIDLQHFSMAETVSWGEFFCSTPGTLAACILGPYITRRMGGSGVGLIGPVLHIGGGTPGLIFWIYFCVLPAYWWQPDAHDKFLHIALQISHSLSTTQSRGVYGSICIHLCCGVTQKLVIQSDPPTIYPLIVKHVLL